MRFLLSEIFIDSSQSQDFFIFIQTNGTSCHCDVEGRIFSHCYADRFQGVSLVIITFRSIIDLLSHLALHQNMQFIATIIDNYCFFYLIEYIRQDRGDIGAI